MPTLATDVRLSAAVRGPRTRLHSAADLLAEARRLVAMAIAVGESDQVSLAPLAELDNVQLDLVRAQARLHRLLTPRWP